MVLPPTYGGVRGWAWPFFLFCQYYLFLFLGHAFFGGADVNVPVAGSPLWLIYSSFFFSPPTSPVSALPQWPLYSLLLLFFGTAQALFRRKSLLLLFFEISCGHFPQEFMNLPPLA